MRFLPLDERVRDLRERRPLHFSGGDGGDGLWAWTVITPPCRSRIAARVRIVIGSCPSPMCKAKSGSAAVRPRRIYLLSVAQEPPEKDAVGEER